MPTPSLELRARATQLQSAVAAVDRAIGDLDRMAQKEGFDYPELISASLADIRLAFARIQHCLNPHHLAPHADDSARWNSNPDGTGAQTPT